MFFKSVLATTLLATIVPSAAWASTEKFTYQQGSQSFEGLVTRPREVSKKMPGMLLVPNWLGVTEKTTEVAERLAGLGYVVFAADVYGKGVRPANAQEAGALTQRYKSDRALFRSRLGAALDVLSHMPGVDASQLVAVGYCFGGTGVLELARAGANLKGVATFHGGLDSPTPADGANIRAKVIAFHGADDPFVPQKDLEAFENEMRTNRIDWQLVKFGGAVHSFTDRDAGNNPATGAAYDARADARSWEIFKLFLSELRN